MKFFSLAGVLLFIIFANIFHTTQTFAAINFTVTPIKYQLDLDPGETVTLPASITNNGPDTVVMPTAISDFTVRDNSGTPRFVRKSELVFPDQQLSEWMTLSQDSVTV